MVKLIKCRLLWSAFLSGVCLLILTGCPEDLGVRFDETAQVSKEGNNICFNTVNKQNYKPTYIGINARGLPSKSKKMTFSPELVISDGKLCIPPSFYHFPNKGQFIAEYSSCPGTKKGPRRVVVVFEINNERVYNVTPTTREIALPYCRFITDGSIKACQL